MIVLRAQQSMILLPPHPTPVSAFAGDLPPEQAEFEVHSQMFTAVGVFTIPVNDAALNGKSSCALPEMIDIAQAP
jgi:hypothetical protein